MYTIIHLARILFPDTSKSSARGNTGSVDTANARVYSKQIAEKYATSESYEAQFLVLNYGPYLFCRHTLGFSS